MKEIWPAVCSHSACAECPESVVVDKIRLFGLKAHFSFIAWSGGEGCTAATSYQARAIPLGQDENIQMPLEVLFCLTDLELILLFTLWPYHN